MHVKDIKGVDNIEVIYMLIHLQNTRTLKCKSKLKIYIKSHHKGVFFKLNILIFSKVCWYVQIFNLFVYCRKIKCVTDERLSSLNFQFSFQERN